MVEPRGHVGTYAGRQLHVRGHAGQEPAVVLIAGCGLAMEYWRGVNNRLDDLHVIAYDRPGMGGTRWPGHLPSLAEEVDSLAALLDAKRVSGAVLVAHSMASFYAEGLARVRPDLVGGIVMVDGSVEWPVRPPAHTFDTLPTGLAVALHTPKLGTLGALGWRLGTWVQSNWDFRRLGYGRIPAIYRDPDSLVNAAAESIAYEQQAWDLLQLRLQHPWPGVPTTILCAGTDEEWIETQTRWAALLHVPQVTVVQDSKHLMMLDCPDIVAGAARRLHDELAAGRADARRVAEDLRGPHVAGIDPGPGETV